MAIAKTDLERRMFNALRRISRQYRSAENLLKHGDCGLEGAEALEMAYENIQAEAKAAIKGRSAGAAPASRSREADRKTRHRQLTAAKHVRSVLAVRVFSSSHPLTVRVILG